MAHPRCDTRAGIENAIQTLAGFNKLIEQRRMARSNSRPEPWREARIFLRDWFVLGRYSLDCVGNVERVRIKIGRLPTNPQGARYLSDLMPRLVNSVLTRKEFFAIVNSQWGMNAWVIHDQSTRVPSPSARCPTCRRPFTIRNCHDVVEVRGEVTISLGRFAGKRRKDILSLLDGNGLERRLFWNYAIRRKGASKYWDLIDLGDEDDRIIQKGDEGRCLVSLFYHTRHLPKRKYIIDKEFRVTATR